MVLTAISVILSSVKLSSRSLRAVICIITNDVTYNIPPPINSTYLQGVIFIFLAFIKVIINFLPQLNMRNRDLTYIYLLEYVKIVYFLLNVYQ